MRYLRLFSAQNDRWCIPAYINVSYPAGSFSNRRSLNFTLTKVRVIDVFFCDSCVVLGRCLVTNRKKTSKLRHSQGTNLKDDYNIPEGTQQHGKNATYEHRKNTNLILSNIILFSSALSYYAAELLSSPWREGVVRP